MLTLDQVKTLEVKVKEALNTIKILKAEKLTFKQQVTEYEDKIKVLENKVSGLETDQSEIEEKISETITLLNQLESVTEESDKTDTEEADVQDNNSFSEKEKVHPTDFFASEETEITESEKVETAEKEEIATTNFGSTEPEIVVSDSEEETASASINEETPATPGFFQDEDSYISESDQSEQQENPGDGKEDEAPGLDIF